jgi:hypothetical protein
MDVFGQFRDAILNRINGNAYLSAGVSATLFPDDDESETEEESLRAINDRLNAVGVAGTLSQLRIDRMEGDRFVCKGGMFWEVNKKQNRSSEGTKKPGRLIFQESLAALRRFVPTILNDASDEVDCFSGLLINWAERIGEENGLELWAIEFETRMAI